MSFFFLSSFSKDPRAKFQFFFPKILVQSSPAISQEVENFEFKPATQHIKSNNDYLLRKKKVVSDKFISNFNVVYYV